MPDNIDKYLPEFDEEDVRNKISGFTRDQLMDTLIYAYKEKRLWAKMLDVELQKLRRIEEIIAEPSTLIGMPGVPTADDLRRMIQEDED
jgi:hypothetical protein